MRFLYFKFIFENQKETILRVTLGTYFFVKLLDKICFWTEKPNGLGRLRVSRPSKKDS